MIIKEFKPPYDFLSNFYPCQIRYDELVFPSVEHAFQAAKTNNINERVLIQQQLTPGKAKRFGRKVTLRPNWENIKKSIMFELVYHKFSKIDLQNQLLRTRNNYIQEGNHWNDTFWGVNLKTGEGENWLGKILMKVRLSYKISQ